MIAFWNGRNYRSFSPAKSWKWQFRANYNTARLFTVLYFSVRSSGSRALRYGLPSCMSAILNGRGAVWAVFLDPLPLELYSATPAPSVHLKIKMAVINGKTRYISTISRKNRGLWTVYKTASSVYLHSDDPKMSQMIFTVLFFYLSHIFIVNIYSFYSFIYLLNYLSFSAIRHLPSAVHRPSSSVRRPPSARRFLVLQSPAEWRIFLHWRLFF